MSETPVDVTAIRARLEAATPGPWEANGPFIEQAAGEYKTVVGMEERGRAYMRYDSLAVRPEDADLIANAPTDIAALLARIEELEAASVPVTRNELAEEERARLVEAWLRGHQTGVAYEQEDVESKYHYADRNNPYLTEEEREALWEDREFRQSRPLLSVFHVTRKDEKK